MHSPVHVPSRRPTKAKSAPSLIRTQRFPSHALTEHLDRGVKTHQRVEVEQHVTLPRRPQLAPRAALGINGVTEEEQLAPLLALLEFRDGIDRGAGRIVRGEAEAQVGRAIVDDEGRVCAAMGVVR